jgi:hypothetical protein
MDRQVDGEEAEYGVRACLFGGRYLSLVLVDGCARVHVGRTSSVPLRYGSSGLRALFRVRRVGGEEVGDEMVTGSYASERPKYDLGPHKLVTTGVPSTNPSPTCTSLSCSPQPSAPASNRLPNGAVYNPRCLTPPALSTLCGHSRCVGMCMFAIEQHTPAFVFARVRMRGVIGHLVLVLGEGGAQRCLIPYVHLRGSGRSR